MKVEKRWQEVYDPNNPFELPQSIAKALRSHAKGHMKDSKDKVKYLWIYVSEQPRREQDDARRGDATAGAPRVLGLDEWLSVVDESSSLGVETLIVTLGCALSKCLNVIAICDWAQASHGMVVGIHVAASPLTPHEARQLMRLDRDMLCVFVDDPSPVSMKFATDMGLKVHPAVAATGGHSHGCVTPECHLPEAMACVGPEGTLYTCGLVLGDAKYRLGHFFERKLGHLMTDESLPHVIPAGLPIEGRGCACCPPLMHDLMREKGSTQGPSPA